MLKINGEKQEEMVSLMSDISEECYCAGWMAGLEFAIWRALKDGNLWYGQSEMDKEKLLRIKELSEETGGWIVWWDEENEEGLCIEEWGERFMPMDEWLDYKRKHHRYYGV
jgi:hypothetical protein